MLVCSRDSASSHRRLLLFQVSANGNVLRSEIVGSIKMRVFLSGMPELRLGLNDKVLFENTGREFPLQIRFCPAGSLEDRFWTLRRSR